MFILKRQDVQISSVQHPKTNQPIPILSYQDQTFRLISVFNASQAEEARSFWRDLTDNKGKACVLLEEPDRYSVWGKVRLDKLSEDTPGADAAVPYYIQACLLLLQAVYYDIEDLLGARQASAFQKEIEGIFRSGGFPEAASTENVRQLLDMDPLGNGQVPSWHEGHLSQLLNELHRLGKDFFGNTSFTSRALDILEDMPAQERGQFLSWLERTGPGKLWKAG